MMVTMAREAAQDAVGVGDVDELLSGVDLVAAVPMSLDTRKPKGAPLPYPNLAWSVAQGINARAAQSKESLITTAQGGHAPVALLSEVAERVGSGKVKRALLCGAEALATFQRAVKQGYTLKGWDTGKVRDSQGKVVSSGGKLKLLPWGDKSTPPFESAEVFATDKGSPAITNRQEAIHGLAAPTTVYALIEQAQRREWRRGESGVTARRRAADRFSGLSEVASREHTHAWFPRKRTPEEIANVSEDNRLVAYPYTKFMCAVMDVDQAACCLVMSEEEALRVGVPRERLVYIHGTAECNESPSIYSARADLTGAQALAVIRRRLEQQSRFRLSDCSVLDIYSCFPCAVEVALRAFSIPLDTPGEKLTLTGGLPYHGGAGNDYSLHSLCAAVPALRQQRDARGLVTANGGYLTKHAACVLSAVPYSAVHGSSPYTRGDCAEDQAEVDGRARGVRIADKAEGEGVLEVWSVLFGRKGPERAVGIGKLSCGSRFVAASRDLTVCERLLRADTFDIPCRVTTDQKGRTELQFPSESETPAAKL
eukprot:Hpha_TRINITY_DN15770_c5_g10::TRINITY_DN15770_c5_g10_i1::g.41316::m.41316/K00626/E2.3.1.9, atoB; acetyl-CoA C-acetyltransferase